MPARPPLHLVALACACLYYTPAHALGRPERALVEQSLRASEKAGVEAALGPGGLDSLTFVAVDMAFDDEARTLEGTTRIEWTNTTGRPLSTVPLRISANGDARGKEPLIDVLRVSVGLDGAPLAEVPAQVVSPSIVEVPLPSPLAPGALLVCVVDTEARLPQLSLDQLDPSSAMSSLTGGQADVTAGGEQYGTFACGAGICTMTGFVPEVPAFLGGKFDIASGSGIGDATYSEPVNALVSVLHPSKAVLAGTGLEIGRVPEKGGRTRTTFALAAGRELGVVASRKFVVTKQSVAGVTVRSFSLAKHKADGKRALDAAVSALGTFDAAFGKYPWSTLDVVEAALTGGAGGVELPTMALGATGFYGEPAGPMAMLGANMQHEILEFITRHEVAHQWWHAQVGSHAQEHPYVDEPLAQYSALVATQKHKGAEAARRARDMQVAINFQALELMGLADGPVARPAGAFQSPVEYAALVYGKAPLYYEALAQELGEANVHASLKAYTQAFRFRRATPDDLRGALARGAGSRAGRVEALWTRWMEEANGAEDVGSLDLMSLMGGMFGGAGASGLGLGLGGAGTGPGAAVGAGAKGKRGAAAGLGGASGKELAEAMKLMRSLFQGIDSDEFKELLREMEEMQLGGAGAPAGGDDEDE